MKIKILSGLLLFALFVSCSTNKNTAKQKTCAEDYLLNTMMIDAVTALNNDDLSKAENLYAQVLVKDNYNASAMYYLSNICFRKQDIAKAIDYGKRAIKADDKNIWYKLQLTDIYLSLQQYDDAALMMEKVVKQDPQVLEYYQQLVNIYHVKGDDKGELSTLERMEKRFGVNETTSMIKYNIYLEKKEKSKAEQEIKNLTKAYPHQSKYWSILAEMQMKEKNYDKAFEYYKKVEELDPDNDFLNFTYANYYLVKKNEDSLYYYLNKAAAQEDMDFKTKMNVIFSVYKDRVDSDTIAFNRFFSLLETMKQTSDTANCELWSMLNLGYMRQANYYQGAYSAKKAIELGCTSFDLYLNWLLAADEYENPNTMIVIADKVIESYPEQPLAYLFKGANQEENKDFENAINTLQLGLKYVGKDKDLRQDFLMYLSDAYYSLGRKDECFQVYETILEINPDNYPILNNYAYYLSLEKKDLDKALEYSKKVVEKYPDKLTFVDTYIWVLYQLGRYQEAKSAAEKVLSLRSDWSNTMQEHYNAILEKVK